MNMLIQNYVKYLEQYDSELIELYGDNYQIRIQETKDLLKKLPITHTTNIAYINPILQQGLLPFSYRGESDYRKSAIFDYDKIFGLDNYVFAGIGYCPKYGPTTGRITILLDDSVSEQQNSFFTFHDLTAILLSNDDNHSNPFVRRIIQQYPYEKIPLNYIYDILARTFLKNGITLESFMDISNFPMAYDPDFQHTNSGRPEIKISGVVPPEKFIGFVVWDEETKQNLVNYGIEESKIILLTKEMNEKKEIYMFKDNFVDTKKR